MFCSLFQIVISFFERISMHLKGKFLRNAKITFKFEWINWFLKYWSQCGRFSSAYSFTYNFFSLIHNSPKWLHCVSGELAALQWCIYYPLMLKFEGKPPKIYVQTHARQPFGNNFIITGVWHWISFVNCCCSDRIRPTTPTNFALLLSPVRRLQQGLRAYKHSV